MDTSSISKMDRFTISHPLTTCPLLPTLELSSKTIPCLFGEVSPQRAHQTGELDSITKPTPGRFSPLFLTLAWRQSRGLNSRLGRVRVCCFMEVVLEALTLIMILGFLTLQAARGPRCMRDRTLPGESPTARSHLEEISSLFLVESVTERELRAFASGAAPGCYGSEILKLGVGFLRFEQGSDG